MRCDYSCESREHAQHRRSFMSGMVAGVAGVTASVSPGLVAYCIPIGHG